MENKSSLFGIIALIIGASGLGLGAFSVVNFQTAEGPQGPPGQDGTDGIDGVNGTSSEYVYAQLEGAAQTFSANSWTGIIFNNMTIGTGISFLVRDINFTHSGIYRITVNFRVGSGSDVWTAIRLYGDTSSRGHSAGFGTTIIELICVSFFANISNLSASYQIQVGRLNSDLSINDPISIAGESLPAIHATIEKID